MHERLIAKHVPKPPGVAPARRGCAVVFSEVTRAGVCIRYSAGLATVSFSNVAELSAGDVGWLPVRRAVLSADVAPTQTINPVR